MKDLKKIEIVWSIAMIIAGIMSIIIAAIGNEFPFEMKIVLVAILGLNAVAIIITTIIKIKDKKIGKS